jgi:Arc/MetJ-type ribon-helix-helix transcriptional regulator
VARSLHVRLDESSAAALHLLRSEGLSDSEAVRAALREAAERRRRRSSLRAEAARLAADPVDRAEKLAILEEMEELAPDWPE